MSREVDGQSDELKANYKVRVLKQVKKRGEKLDLKNKSKLEIIGHISRLKFWDNNKDDYEYETAFEALEFKFYAEQKWIRVFVFKDDERKIMHVIHVCKKKDNQIEKEHKIAVETIVRMIKNDIRRYKKEKELEDKKGKLDVFDGGKK